MFRKYLPLPLIPVIAAPMALLAPILLAGKTIFWGTPALQFIPWRDFGWELLSKGYLPLWNPLLGMGAPLVANYQSAFFYPPNWIEGFFWAIGGVPWQAWGQTLLVMLHLIWAGIGTTILVRRLGVGLLGQTIAGIAFGCSGYLVARAGFISINAAVAWLPWILLGSWLLVSQPLSRKIVVGLVVTLTMQLLAGHAQTVWYTYLFSSLWVGFWGWQKALYKTDSSETAALTTRASLSTIVVSVLGAWAMMGLAILLSAGLASVQLFPTAEYLLHSQRATAVDFDYAMNYSFWPWRILGLFVPDLFGNPAHGDFWGYATYWEDAFYIGLLPALLALSVLLRPGKWPHLPVRDASDGWAGNPLQIGKIRRSLAIFLWVILIVGFSLAMGKNTPLFPWLYRYIPTFSLFQAPARFLIWVEISLVLLAAMGADRWRRPEKRALYWTRLATAGGFAISLGAALAWFLTSELNTLPAISLSMIIATALAGFWGMLAGGLSILAPVAQTSKLDLYMVRGQRIWVWSVAIVVGVDLIVAGWGLNPGMDVGFYRQVSTSLLKSDDLVDSGRLYLPEDDEDELKYSRFFRFDTFDPGEDWQAMRTVLLPNLNMLDKVASVNNFDPLLSGRYVRWMEYLSDANPTLRADWLNLMAVSVVETLDIRSPGGVRFEPVVGITSETASEISTAHAHIVPCARFVPDGEAAWQAMVSGRLDYSQEVVIERLAADPENGCQGSSPGSAELVEAKPAKLRYLVDSSSSAWLVLADQWYPGWYASIDGQPVAIERADFLFRAVRIGPGQHLVEFNYRPASFLVGSVISLGGLACLLLSAIIGIFTRRASSQTSDRL